MKQSAKVALYALAIGLSVYAGYGASRPGSVVVYLIQAASIAGAVGSLWATRFVAPAASTTKDTRGVAECVNDLTRITLWASERKHEALVASAGVAIDECHKINLDDDVPAAS